MLHALGARDDVLVSLECCQIGCHEAHCGATGFNVNHLRHVAQSVDNHLCVIAVRQVFRHDTASCLSVDDECAVADAFRRWQFNACVDMAGSLNDILHVLFYV